MKANTKPNRVKVETYPSHLTKMSVKELQTLKYQTERVLQKKQNEAKTLIRTEIKSLIERLQSRTGMRPYDLTEAVIDYLDNTTNKGVKREYAAGEEEED